MKKRSKHFLSILVRYTILIIVALPNLWLFYFIFTPLTAYPLYFLFSLFFEVSLAKNVIIISNCIPIELIEACIAGSAYYLLLILNLSTPNIKLKKRLKIILFSFATLLIINIIRIFVLSLMYIGQYAFFDITHKLFWYLLSIVFVAGIWFTEVRLFKIKHTPFYSDLKYLYKKSSFK